MYFYYVCAWVFISKGQTCDRKVMRLCWEKWGSQQEKSTSFIIIFLWSAGAQLSQLWSLTAFISHLTSTFTKHLKVKLPSNSIFNFILYLQLWLTILLTMVTIVTLQVNGSSYPGVQINSSSQITYSLRFCMCKNL